MKPPHFWIGGITWVSAAAALLMGVLAKGPAFAAPREPMAMAVTVAPAASGQQLVRLSVPFPARLLSEGQSLTVSDGQQELRASLRELSWHPGADKKSRSVRRALVTFPYKFANKDAVRFTLKPAPAKPGTSDSRFPVDVKIDGEGVTIAYRDGPTLSARLVAPARKLMESGRPETVERNSCVHWQRWHLPDPQWPRILEVRTDVLGSVVLLVHLQRGLPDDGRAPDLGWVVETRSSTVRLRQGDKDVPVTSKASHAFADGQACTCFFEDGGYHFYHPTAPLKRRGMVEVVPDREKGLTYRYQRCTAEEKVPMQQSAWHRAELVVAPAELAPLTATLEYPHTAQIDWRVWDELYHTGPPLDLEKQPELAALMRYHHDAVLRAMACGDDWGNVTAYADGRSTGGVYGMNRLNHCPAIFEEGQRSGDRRLLDTAVLWCDNFFDQSIWWGPDGTGGTRYVNVIRLGRSPPDSAYMWRSNSASNFCTKGYDAFFLAYEQTGDPRMREALAAQVRYAGEHVHADRGECRNVGDARDFIRLYQYTGDKKYLEEALRLFRQLRSKLSTGNLFSQNGLPLLANPPFIDDDDRGYQHPFAKPYILGYALAGLPDLARQAPKEPKLREVVQTVADFLAESQDPLGGWRYPHPRSSYVMMSQAMEHAWQLVQADRLLGPQEKHLDAIEHVLRQRILAWQKTRKIFAGLDGWEITTGKVKERKALYGLYKLPGDRDPTRDYLEGGPRFGGAAPECLVYFPEVLAFYLKHRPAARLLAPARDVEPLAKVLARVKAEGP